MKRIGHNACGIAIGACLLMAVGCGHNGGKPGQVAAVNEDADQVTATFVESVPPLVMEISREATEQLMAELQHELQQAMKSGGAAHAVSFCATRALPITMEVESRFSENVGLKRTALNFRNPSNQPDQWETEAIHYLQSIKDKETQLPDYLYQSISKAGETTYRTYRPILIGKPCLGCHGTESAMNPELLSLIREHYPKGKATGHAEGDLRGVLRVEIRP